MDLRALKSSDKKAKSSSFQNIGSKIPISVRSPARTKVKPSVTNTIVCSTPLNTARRNLFDNDNQQMSPIRNTSPATTSGGVCPIKLVDEKPLEKELEISKISEEKPQVKAKNSVPSKKEIEESLYPFPLVNHIQVLKMIVCDSEDETLKKSSRNTKRKSSRKTATNNTELMRKSKKKSVVTDISKKNTRLTRSKTETTNKSPRKKTTRSISNSFPKSNKVDQNEFLSNVELENSAIPLETINKINKDILNDKSKNSSKFISNDNENKIIESNFDSLLHCEFNKNNVIVDAHSLPINSSKNKKTKKDILNGDIAKTNQANVQILKVSNTTKTAVDIHDNNIFENITSSNIEQDNSNNTESSEPTKRGRIEAVNSEEIVKSNHNTNDVPEPKTQGRPETINSNVTVNNNGISNTIVVDKNKIFGNKTMDLKFEQAIDIYGKSSKPNKRGRKPKTVNSKVTENRLNLRKSTRKRRSGYAKYWKIDKQEKKLNISQNKSMRPVEISPKTLKTSQINEPTKIEGIICNNPEEIKTTEVQEDKKLSGLNKKLSTKRKSKEFKFQTIRKLRTSLSSNRLSKPPKKTVKKQNKLQLIENDTSYTTEEENEIPGDTQRPLSSNLLSESSKKTVIKQDTLQLTGKNTSYTTEKECEIPGDTLVLHITKMNTEKELLRENGQKRKVEINPGITEPKKVRLQPNTSRNGFKNLAIAANIGAQVAGLADVHIDGNRCLLECFGKFPQKYIEVSQNSDISIGISIDNGRITTGVIQMVPLGRKNYEYIKKVDLLFIVLEGIAEVGIGNSSQVLRIGQNFYVPKNTAYYILNVSSTDTLLIHFSKIYEKT